MKSVATRPRKRAQQARSLATVEAILDATARVLISDGYDHASTKRIAKAARLSIGSLYQYFPTKEAVVAALLERHIDQVFQLLEVEIAQLGDADLPTAVRRGVRAFLSAQGVDLRLRRVFIEQVPRIGRLNRVGEIERRAVAVVRLYLESQRRRIVHPDLELAAAVVTRSIAHLTYDALVDPAGASLDAWVVEISALVIGYLTTPRS